MPVQPHMACNLLQCDGSVFFKSACSIAPEDHNHGHFSFGPTGKSGVSCGLSPRSAYKCRGVLVRFLESQRGDTLDAVARGADRSGLDAGRCPRRQCQLFAAGARGCRPGTRIRIIRACVRCQPARGPGAARLGSADGWGGQPDLSQTCAREAEEKGVSLADHAAHLIVHGLLHLAGHDHETSIRDAQNMEKLEIKALAILGIANPYSDHPLHQGDE